MKREPTTGHYQEPAMERTPNAFRDELPLRLFEAMLAVSRDEGPLEEDTPAARVTREFLANNWARARDGLLAKTRRIEVQPEMSAAPRVFHFAIHRPYKRKAADGSVELVPGPIFGTVFYRHDLFTCDDDVPTVAVALHDRATFHANFSRRYGLLCLGAVDELGGAGGGPIPLDRLLEHVYRIMSYANFRVTHPADPEAARYFATDPDALRGLEHVEPLY
jgi:hypothetical protein